MAYYASFCSLRFTHIVVGVIPLPEFKKLLGTAADRLSDGEIEHIRNLQDRLAEVVFEMWLEYRNGPDPKQP